jgi:hypothetical protein
MGARGLRALGFTRVLFCNVLYCSMGSEHYVSLMGIGFEGFIYIMFYCSILLLNDTRLRMWKASALCEGGLPKGKIYFGFVVSPNNRTIPQKTPKNLIKSKA